MKKYHYRTAFKLADDVNDYEAAVNYLTEDDMTKYLKDDEDIPYATRGAIISVDWELKDVNHGYINLYSTRELTEQELEPISSWVKGQNSDGLGEGFEQQEFADAFNEDAFKDDLDEWEEYYREAYDKWDDLSEEEQDNYGGQDDYANEYANQQWGYEPTEQDDCYHTMCSFDWQTNDYLFEFYELLDD